MNQKSSLRKIPLFVSQALTANTFGKRIEAFQISYFQSGLEHLFLD
ncbi:hypothetical protein ABIF31_000114 [Bradyrhizobium elkanii]